MKELNALRKQLSNEQIASFYADQFFSNLAENKEAEAYFSKIVVANIEKYKKVDQLRGGSNGNTEFEQLVLPVLKIFPAYGFIICNELDKRPDYYAFSKALRVSTAASMIARKNDFQANAMLFLNQINPEHDLEQLEDKIKNQNTKDSYLPAIMSQDLGYFIKTISSPKTSTNPHELIEISYYFKAIKQLFLKYYFYMVGQSQSDFVAVHFNRMFGKLLLTVRQQEMGYWGKYKNGKKLHAQLLQTISKDQPSTRHPHLRKHIFDTIDKFNPVFQNGAVKTTVIEVRQLLAKQLAIFYELSVNRLVLMLDLLLKTEGSEHVVYLLTQLSRVNIEKVFDLQDHLNGLTSQKTKLIQQLVSAYSAKLPGAKRRQHQAKKNARSAEAPVHKTLESQRTKHAKKRLTETEGKRGMTQDQVPKFLEERLKKLFAKAKKEGALTQDKIPEYLAKFASIAEKMVAPIPIGEQQIIIEEFQAATEEILDDISAEGQLSDAEVLAFKEDIKEKTKSLNTEDVEARTDIVDEIGVTLAEASTESEKRKEKDDDAELNEFFAKELIPYGLDKQAKRISIKEFFEFPFGDFNGPNEDDWFGYHIKYLQIAVKENKLEKSNFVKIYNSLDHLPKVKYKKYFNIFPNEQFEETTFMAVFDLWKNKAFDRLRED